MTFNEMRLVKHLVESAREIAQDDRERSTPTRVLSA
jgi:hypothetical protein